MLSYLNRGLFIDVSEGNFVQSSQISHTQGEINSVLEFVLMLAGYSNDIDEDGDFPEDYISFQFLQTSIYEEFIKILEYNNISTEIKNRFCVYADNFSYADVYRQIDHPPKV